MTEGNIDKRTSKRRLGDLGENLACEFLCRRGFEIIDRNYSRKWGELDIVAKKANIIHFVEVKSVSYETIAGIQRDVTHETNTDVDHRKDEYRPEDNIHPWKLKRLARIMQTYLLHKKLDHDFQLDIITVKIDEEARQGRVELIENVVI